MNSNSGFKFAIGAWNYSTRAMKEDGTYAEWPVGSWKFWNILGGSNVQDEFTQPTPEGEIIKGTMFRAYDSSKQKWICRGLVTGHDSWDDYVAEDTGSSIVMIGRSPLNSGVLERVTFHSFRENSWERTLDVSIDDGGNWIEKVALVKAERA